MRTRNKKKLKAYTARIYFSGFCTYQVKAETEEQAIEKAHTKTIKKNEIFSNLENWPEADEIV